jgi:retron-type reverse transcriptase
MDIIEKLKSPALWQDFLDYKLSKGHLTKGEERDLTDFILNKEYSAVAERLNCGGFFSVPEVVQINKRFSEKKRTVFTFSREENYVLKMLAYLLLDYDGIFADNLYSFRKNTGVKKAITRLVNTDGIDSMFSYKLDISDYFNSVDTALLLPMLRELLAGEDRLYTVLEELLTNPLALSDGTETEVKKGIMAGCPVSGFLANLFISALDRHFEETGALYARYSDDIIVFAKTREELDGYIDYLGGFLASHRLTVNPSKIYISEPHGEWTFLGFCYSNGKVDISDISKQKLKKKMRRKARALLRWRLRKNAPPDRAVAAYIRYFNRKLFDNPVNSELTWSRWYFPLINTCDSLKELDAYMQQCIRYIATGKHTKAQFNYTYEKMKELGYLPLTAHYYKMREGSFRR